MLTNVEYRILVTSKDGSDNKVESWESTGMSQKSIKNFSHSRYYFCSKVDW